MIEEGGDDVVIRTMKDDLAGVPKLPVPAKPAPPPPLGEARPDGRQTFPLPPKETTPTYTIRPPRRRKRRWLKGTLLTLLVLVIVSAAGWAAFAYFFAAPAAPEEIARPQATATLSAIIPRAATFAVQYRVETPQDRATLLQIWQGSAKSSSQGNPTDLLRDPNTSQIMYVMLEGENRPFLLIPQSSLAEDIIAQSSGLQSIQHQGWIISHAFNPARYQESLTGGTLAETTPALAFSSSGNGVVRFYLGPTALNQIRETSFGGDFAVGRLQEVAFAGAVQAREGAISLQGIGMPASEASASLSPQDEVGSQHLLSLIPADAAGARLGANLAHDLTGWQEVSRVIDGAVLSQPAVAALVPEFSTPYAWYHRAGADGVTDFGLIVTLPVDLQPELQLGDATLEQALRALVPLVTEERVLTDLAFADGLLREVPLRFVNLTGSTAALDYALTETHLLVATSKEGIEALLGTAVGLPAAQAGLEASPKWNSLFTAWGALPSGRDLIVADLNYPPLVDLLPAPAQFGLAITPEEAVTALQGVLVLNTL